MKKILNLSFIPINNDLGLLALRIMIGLSLFTKHGIEKLTNFSGMQQHFPDPIHVGPTIGLSFALLSDGICSILVIIGFGTRIASFLIFFNLLVVFLFLHHFSFMDGHAELVYAYMAGFLALVIAGPGKYSLDKKILKL